MSNLLSPDKYNVSAEVTDVGMQTTVVQLKTGKQKVFVQASAKSRDPNDFVKWFYRLTEEQISNHFR